MQQLGKIQVPYLDTQIPQHLKPILDDIRSSVGPTWGVLGMNLLNQSRSHRLYKHIAKPVKRSPLLTITFQNSLLDNRLDI